MLDFINLDGYYLVFDLLDIKSRRIHCWRSSLVATDVDPMAVTATNTNLEEVARLALFDIARTRTLMI